MEGGGEFFQKQFLSSSVSFLYICIFNFSPESNFLEKCYQIGIQELLKGPLGT